MQLDLATLEAVNTEVNNAVTFVSDWSQWGVDDRWEDAMETRREDCDGFEIAKLRMLLALNWPRADLKIGLCWVETGEYHAVLVATFDAQDYVLDNRYPGVKRWQDLPYTWDRFYLLGAKEWRKSATPQGPVETEAFVPLTKLKGA